MEGGRRQGGVRDRKGGKEGEEGRRKRIARYVQILCSDLGERETSQSDFMCHQEDAWQDGGPLPNSGKTAQSCKGEF